MESHFIAAVKNEIQQFKVSENFYYVYPFMAGLSKLLADYAAKTSEVTFAVSSSMEKKYIEENQLKGAGHNVVMYSANYFNLHLGDLLFYNMGNLLRKRKPAGHTIFVFQYARDIPMLFPPLLLRTYLAK